MYAPLFCQNPFQARLLCRRRLSSEIIRCLRLSVRWISTLKKFPGALHREMRCLHAGGQLCECFPDVCTYYLYANPSHRVLTEEAHLSRGKNTYTLYIYAETFECARKFRSAAWRSWQTTSLAKQDFAAARVRVGVCVAEENV